MIRSCVTVSLVPQARGGPFIFWDDLPAACSRASELGFDAVEIFPPGAAGVRSADVKGLLDRHGLRLAAMGTGAGWVIHKLTVTHPEAAERRKAIDFIRSIIDVAGPLGGSTIIGSMQGRSGGDVSSETAMGYLADAGELGAHASQFGVPLFFEPLNRYETNLVTSVADGLALLRMTGGGNVKLLCDLFHMNIEEQDVAASLRAAGASLGHVHFADSNRRPAGCGHTDFAAVVAALRHVGYSGYLSAEALPYPTPDEAAVQTMRAFRRYTAPQT